MEQSFAVGAELSQVVRLALKANLAVGIVGPHGIGKSELLAQVAADLSVQYIVRDLSLMEPVDLVGLPIVSGSSTKFLPPAFLPTSGSGILVIEELNRAPRHVITPCLQLLTARTLNDYALPPDWQIVATWNEGEAYQVFELDPALRSRFVILHAHADSREWLKWAATQNVPSALLSFIENSPKVFSDPEANPRAWFKVSRLIRAYEQGDLINCEAALLGAVTGCIGAVWARSFLKYYFQKDKPLSADEVLREFHLHRASFQQWASQCRLDLVRASMLSLRKQLEDRERFEELRKSKTQKTNLHGFLSLLPADFLQEYTRWAKNCGYWKAGREETYGI